MKNKIFILLIALSCFIGYEFHQNEKTISYLDLALTDVEALASGEEIVVTCGAREGRCWYITRNGRFWVECGFLGYQHDHCVFIDM